jgi:hypothetical protein
LTENSKDAGRDSKFDFAAWRLDAGIQGLPGSRMGVGNYGLLSVGETEGFGSRAEAQRRREQQKKDKETHR